MDKQITSALLVAGTCIGGGTIALPIVLAKIGIIPSVLVTLFIWLLNYYPSLMGMELNLRSDRGLSLGSLGNLFSGRGIQIVGELSVKLFSYAALTMHLCGTSSIIQRLLEKYLQCEISTFAIETFMAIAGIILLSFPFKIISSVNNVMFTGFICVFGILLITMFRFLDFGNMPWFLTPTAKDILSMCPVIFASYGHQLVLHAIRDYCGRDAAIIKQGILTGSMIPTIVYMMWPIASLGIIFSMNPEFFVQMTSGKIEVGVFIRELSNISSLPSFQLLVWLMAILAILTSYVGVGIGLAESMNFSLEDHIKSTGFRKLLAAISTIVPAYAVAVIVPDAFVKILGFLGAILVVIGILIPAYLIFKIGIGDKPYYKELKKWPIIISVICGLIIMFAEIFLNN